MKSRTLVWQIMSHPVKRLPADIGIRKAAKMLQAWGISGAPVVDDRGSVVGVLSLRDLAGCLAARALGLPALFPSLDGPGDSSDSPAECPALDDFETAKVSDLMTPGIRCVDPESPIREAIRQMRLHALHRIFVRRGNGPVKGVITTTDILRWVERMGSDSPANRRTG